MATRITEPTRHIAELDGLRGVAILAVMAFHLRPSMPYFGHFRFVYYILDAGRSGVDLFFVLSGFLITTILLNTKESPQYFRSFYGRRAVRIFPLYFAALIAFYHIHLPLMHRAGVWQEVTHSDEIWYWTYLANWRQIAEFSVVQLDHFWSLCIEEQFYFIWPAMVYFCSARMLPRMCTAIAATAFGLGIVLDLSGAPYALVYRGTETRIGTLVCGALLAWIAQHPEWIGKFSAYLKMVFAVAFGTFMVVDFVHWRWALPLTNSPRYLPASIGLSALVLDCVAHAGSSDVLCKVARNPILRSFGKYSYALYVVHIFMKHMVSAYVASRLPKSAVVAFGMSLLSMVSAYALAVISWNLLEKHFLRLKKHFPYEMPRTEATASPALQQQAVPATAGE